MQQNHSSSRAGQMDLALIVGCVAAYVGSVFLLAVLA